ncbi:DUF1798 family protein [Virgibacillus sp. W0430]|uniref:DUF1798 family protein n=1 Tax=Virgibacillus sp. W0430 TaxID=3391580 RepID=UPI003F4718ED
MLELKNNTKQLIKELDALKIRYDNGLKPQDKNDKQFFLYVKKETNPIYLLLEQWQELSLQAIKQRKVNVHPHQIVSTKENMELLLLHSYYIDARRKRYMELNKSCNYIFNQLLNEL